MSDKTWVTSNGLVEYGYEYRYYYVGNIAFARGFKKPTSVPKKIEWVGNILWQGAYGYAEISKCKKFIKGWEWNVIYREKKIPFFIDIYSCEKIGGVNNFNGQLDKKFKLF